MKSFDNGPFGAVAAAMTHPRAGEGEPEVRTLSGQTVQTTGEV
ncbi:hypothetical protein QO004_004030 [Rhizobium mesoamericanum]|nr:hypothetical protein [Rhizobium mesoamericanum]MDQ0562225.1 hypothetical protein [Rhizobium mesoamericanum]